MWKNVTFLVIFKEFSFSFHLCVNVLPHNLGEILRENIGHVPQEKKKNVLCMLNHNDVNASFFKLLN